MALNERRRLSKSTSWQSRFGDADSLDPDAPPAERRERGRDFERILFDMLESAGLAPRTSYRPVGEEIDGSFYHSGRTLLLEAKWTKDTLPASSIYAFRGKVDGKLVGTIGVFFSVAGFSRDAVDALVAGKIINVILFDGDDIRTIAGGQVEIGTALDFKLRAAAESGSPFAPLRDSLTKAPPESESEKAHADESRIAFIVEDRFDSAVLRALFEIFGEPSVPYSVVVAGGILNMTRAARFSASRSGGKIVIIADGDGDPASVEQVVRDGLIGWSESDIPVNVVVLNPSLEEAIGLTRGYAEVRKRVLLTSTEMMRSKLRKIDLHQVAKADESVRELITALGIRV